MTLSDEINNLIKHTGWMSLASAQILFSAGGNGLIILRSTFMLILIPDNTEFSVTYDDEEKYGEPGDDLYLFGNIIIRTIDLIYRFEHVYAAYDYAARICRYIMENIDRPTIDIDLEELNPNWEKHNGVLTVERAHI